MLSFNVHLFVLQSVCLGEWTTPWSHIVCPMHCIWCWQLWLKTRLHKWMSKPIVNFTINKKLCEHSMIRIARSIFINMLDRAHLKAKKKKKRTHSKWEENFACFIKLFVFLCVCGFVENCFTIRENDGNFIGAVTCRMIIRWSQ